MGEHRERDSSWREEEALLLKFDALPSLMDASEALDGAREASGDLHVWVDGEMSTEMRADAP